MDKETIKRALLSVALLVALLVSVIAFAYILYTPHCIVYIWAAWASFMLFWACWFIAGEILSHPWVSGGEKP